MNKKMTPRVIRLIALQCVVIIITISVVGFAVMKHSEYKHPENTTTTSAEGTTAPTNRPTVPTQPSQSTSSSTSQSSESGDTNTEASSTTLPSTAEHPYAYAGFTPQITNVNVDFTKILVNGKYSLPADYKPTLSEAVPGSGQYLDYRVAPYYQKMYNAAKADGIILTPISGYRSYQRQKNNFENRITSNMNKGYDRVEATKLAATVIMIPGASEHNAGLAMDICSLADSFENTKEFEWLDAHAAEYGFILRYPKDAKSREITGVVYEPWHYRYVGVEAAKEIKARGITFEEYVGLA